MIDDAGLRDAGDGRTVRANGRRQHDASTGIRRTMPSEETESVTPPARRVAWAVASGSLAQPHSSLLVSSQAPYVRIMTSPSASCSVTSTIWSAALITATESAPPAGVRPMCSWTV